MNRNKANNKRGKHKLKSRTEAKRIPTAGDKRWRDKLAYTAPYNKRFVESEGDHCLPAHQSHRFPNEPYVASPAGFRHLCTPTKSVHFIDQRRLESHIESSIYNADRGLEKVRPGWLYGRSKPVLVGRHHRGESRPVPRAGSRSDVRYMSTAPDRAASDVDSRLDGARGASIRLLIEQSSRFDERRKHQQRQRRQPVRRKDDDGEQHPVGREAIGHRLNAIKVINVPDGRSTPLQRVVSLWNKRRSVGFRAGASVTKHQRAHVNDVVEVREHDADARTPRRCHVELGDIRTPEAASRHHRQQPIIRLPTVVSRCSRYHHQLLQLPNREPKIPGINTGVSVWGYKRMPAPSGDRYEQQYIIQHSRPLVTTPVTPRPSADPDDEPLAEPWSPIRIVSEANGVTQAGLGRILASRCPECYIESKML